MRAAIVRCGAFARRTLHVEQGCRSLNKEGNETCLFWGHCARCVTAKSLWYDTIVFQPRTCTSNLVKCSSRSEMGLHNVGNLGVAKLDMMTVVRYESRVCDSEHARVLTNCSGLSKTIQNSN